MDNETIQFAPPRRRGLILHIGLLLVSLGVGSVLFLLATRQQAGVVFMLYLLAALLILAPAPILGYRAYALIGAGYALQRDGLRIRWGLRAEDIPLPGVEWVREARDLGYRLPLPPFALPGAILGSRQTADLGKVEFVASDADNLLLVATTTRVYAISPVDAAGFMRNFQYSMELGSITPLSSLSVKPAAFIGQTLQSRLVRWLLLVGAGLNVALFILISIVIASRASISLGFDINGLPVEPGPSARLLLLSVLSVLVYIADLLAGLFFFRHPRQRAVAYLLWISAVITIIILAAAAVVLVSL